MAETENYASIKEARNEFYKKIESGTKMKEW